MDREHDEVVDGDGGHFRREVDDDVALRGGDRGLELLRRGDAHRLGAEELMRRDLGRGGAAGERLRALSAVTGPMHAISASPRIAGSRSSGKARTKLLTVDELVNVITSTPSPSNRRSSAGPASGGQTARYTGSISTSAPRFASSDGSASLAISARGTSTRNPASSQPWSALASPSAVYSDVTSSGRTPWAMSESAVSCPIAHSLELCNARASEPVVRSIWKKMSTALAEAKITSAV